MGNEVETLIEQARALPLQDRVALVEGLLESLDRADPDMDRLKRTTGWRPIGEVSLRPRTWSRLSPSTDRDGQVS
jgi:hypothetical protein